MDYGNNKAADRLEQGGGEEPAGDTPPKPDGSREDTFYLPPDFPGADMLKPGDPINLRVVGKDGDGGIEVEHMPMPGDGEPEWRSDLKKSVPNTPGGAGMGNESDM